MMSSKRKVQTRIRSLKEDSVFKLCDYRPTCRKGDRCIRAHSEAELDAWREEFYKTVREYKPKFFLKSCDHRCQNPRSCSYAHSQAELESWFSTCNGPCRESHGKMLDICRNGQDCEYGEECRYAHNPRELQNWEREHHEMYIESEDSIPERCTYTVKPPTCQLGVTCPYAHTEKERHELIKKLSYDQVAIERPVPRADKLLPYNLCENHKNERKSSKDGECIYGVRCRQAHTEEELRSWEIMRKKKKGELKIRPFYGGESRLVMCPRRGSCSDDVDCVYAHSMAELQVWKMTATSTMFGAMEDGNRADPFLVSLVDYQRRFSDELAKVLNKVVITIHSTLKDEETLGSFIDYTRTKIDLSTQQGQQSVSLYDVQYLLGYIQRNVAVFAKFLEMDESDLVGIVSDLLEVRNMLAHGMCLTLDAPEKLDIAIKFIQRGINLVECSARKLQDKEIQEGLSELRKIQKTFRDYVAYQHESEKRMKSYDALNSRDKKASASKVLKLIQELFEEEEEPGQVTTFLAIYLGARFRKTQVK